MSESAWVAGFTGLAVEALHLTEAHALLTVIQTAHFESSGDNDVLEMLHDLLASCTHTHMLKSCQMCRCAYAMAEMLSCVTLSL